MLFLLFNAQRFVLVPLLWVWPLNRQKHIAHRQRRRKPIAQDAGWLAMAGLTEAAKQTGVRLFPISGTLLGLYRHGGILPHDVDIDMGVFLEDPQLVKFMEVFAARKDVVKVEAVCLAEGYRKSNPWLPQVPGNIVGHKIYMRPGVGEKKPTVEIDIFLHVASGGYILHGIDNRLWLNTMFQLETRNYGGMELLVPSNVEHYLAENYGDYKTVKTDFENLTDCPNSAIVAGPSGFNYLLKVQRIYALANWGGRLATLRDIYVCCLRQLMSGTPEHPLWRIRGKSESGA